MIEELYEESLGAYVISQSKTVSFGPSWYIRAIRWHCSIRPCFISTSSRILDEQISCIDAPLL